MSRALSALRDLSSPGRMDIDLTVAAKTDSEAIDEVVLANRVREPLDEDDDLTFTEELGQPGSGG